MRGIAYPIDETASEGSERARTIFDPRERRPLAASQLARTWGALLGKHFDNHLRQFGAQQAGGDTIGSC